jgi:phosphonate transport system substrate-binding protein
MKYNHKLILIIAGVSAGIFLALSPQIFFAAERDDSDSAGKAQESNIGITSDENTRKLIIGTIHDEAAENIEKMQPTADYLSSKLSDMSGLNYTGHVVIARSDAQMIQLLKAQKIDLYFDSPLITAAVTKQSGAEPFLFRWKEGVEEYHTVFVVRKDVFERGIIHNVSDFAGKTIGFEEPYSTSGYFLPKTYLLDKGFTLVEQSGPLTSNITESSTNNKNGLDSKTINFVFTRDDENTALWVVEGRVEIGTFSNIDFEQEPSSLRDQLKIVASTFSVPRSMVSHRADLDSELVAQITQILLDMDKDTIGKQVLANYEDTAKYSKIEDRDKLMSNLHRMVE